MLTNIFKGDEFEKLLVANWSKFLDTSKLLGFVLKKVQENTNNLAIISGSEIKTKGVKLTISRFQFSPNGFNIWAEFIVPVANNKIADGTMELFMNLEGNINHRVTMGVLHCS